jgi:hypothetical protein
MPKKTRRHQRQDVPEVSPLAMRTLPGQLVPTELRGMYRRAGAVCAGDGEWMPNYSNTKGIMMVSIEKEEMLKEMRRLRTVGLVYGLVIGFTIGVSVAVITLRFIY